MAIYDELEELTGRLTVFMINFPDSTYRLNESIDMYNRALNGLITPQGLAWMGSDMAGLIEYFKALYQFDELKAEIKPILELLHRLTEPA